MSRGTERPVCATCGNFDVSLELTAGYWNPGTAQAEAGDLCDKGHYCDRCERGVKLDWIETVSPELTMQEFDTIIAALRHWQWVQMYNPNVGSRINPDTYAIACDHGEPLDADAIDALCERINA